MRWCKHCQALIKPWRILAGSCAAYADTLEAAGDSAVDSLVVASFDCEASRAHTSFCKELGIQAFPHIRYVEGDTLSVDYMGTRSLTDLVIFAEMQTGIGPFEGIGGMTRLKAYGIRYLLSVLQFLMETNNDTGSKPSLQTMITMCVIFTVPLGDRWMCNDMPLRGVVQGRRFGQKPFEGRRKRPARYRRGFRRESSKT